MVYTKLVWIDLSQRNSLPPEDETVTDPLAAINQTLEIEKGVSTKDLFLMITLLFTSIQLHKNFKNHSFFHEETKNVKNISKNVIANNYFYK